MSASSSKEVTRLLHAWRGGDSNAFAALTPLVYRELHRLAQKSFRGERANHTLQPTALVNEAFLSLVDAKVEWQDRAHFFALAARQMRRILVNHAVAKKTDKRGGGEENLPLEDVQELAGNNRVEITDIDDALTKLADFDSRKSEILELYYFAGLTYEEMAECLQLSTSTLNSELRLAKAWLKHALSEARR